MAGSVWLWDGKAFRRCAGRPAPGDVSGVPADGDAVVDAGAGQVADGLRGARVLVLNGGAAAFAGWDRDEIERRLRRAGAAVRAPERQAVRRFDVSLFHLLPLAVEKLRPAGRALRGESAAKAAVPEQDARYRPMVRLATRALYAVGLDNGVVELADDGEGKCFVAGIRLPDVAAYRSGPWRAAAADLAERLRTAGGARHGNESETGRATGDGTEAGQVTGIGDEHAAGKAAENLARNVVSAAGKVTEHGAETAASAILLGADPEFLLLAENGKVVSAARYLEGGHGAGCDAVVVGGAVRHPVAELRPAPSPSPGGLAANLRRLLREAARRIPDQPPLRWAAGGMPAAGFALGGHIHLSGVPLTGRLLRQLDSYVAFPLAMIESPSEQARRPRYGALGDFRLQPHGGFEYRTLPSWLASPLAAKAAFALALLCARESDALAYLPSEDDRYAAAYYAGDRPALVGCLEELAASMAATASYGELARWIEPLLQAIRAGRTWDAAGDFRPKWRIGPPNGLSAP